MKCQHCGSYHEGMCPRIKAVEYHPNGTIKRVEYWNNQKNYTGIYTQLSIPFTWNYLTEIVPPE